jgi:hypothetical protein
MQTQSTYKRHCEETRAYGWTPMDYITWLSWRVMKPMGKLTDEDRAKHPES